MALKFFYEICLIQYIKKEEEKKSGLDNNPPTTKTRKNESQY